MPKDFAAYLRKSGLSKLKQFDWANEVEPNQNEASVDDDTLAQVEARPGSASNLKMHEDDTDVDPW